MQECWEHEGLYQTKRMHLGNFLADTQVKCFDTFTENCAVTVCGQFVLLNHQMKVKTITRKAFAFIDVEEPGDFEIVLPYFFSKLKWQSLLSSPTIMSGYR
ncbi:hypothetical protein AVEN_86284-1 [Araneus ventricosus]|uniref:Uncharacterized protein n=1 Tax=Araneus ventricosus TaxID=182803 RepID=A0A4Y2KAW8_ARAVE|nr:hypothetical protein AVEN_86284-1 [Araneus ventricosus]